MDKVTIACVQQRNVVVASQEEFEAQARRFVRLAQAKSAQLVVFPELAGLMVAPSLFSGMKRSFIKRADKGKQPGAGAVQRGVQRLADAAAGALGGYWGSLDGLLRKNSGGLWQAYVDTFGKLAQESGIIIVGGSLYVRDYETDTLRHRAHVFGIDGCILGYQDKLNLAPDEQEWVVPGTDLAILDAPFGRFGLLIGQDLLYPELARLVAVQGADLLVGIAAMPGAAQAQVIRSALALRAEENQIFTAASFLLGPNYLGQVSREDYLGQSAILAPASLTNKGSGVLTQVGTNRAESLIAAELDYEQLRRLWRTSDFRPRQQMNLGNLGLVLAEMYRDGLTIEQGIEQRIAGPVAEAAPEPSIELSPLLTEVEQAEEAEEAPAEAEQAEEILVVPSVLADRPGSELEDASEAALPEASDVQEET
jgi:predicted amidohydrolase